MPGGSGVVHMSEGLEQAIQDAASGAAKVNVDGVATESHNLKDLIEADKYLASKKAGRRPGPPFRTLKIVPPGAV